MEEDNVKCGQLARCAYLPDPHCGVYSNGCNTCAIRRPCDSVNERRLVVIENPLSRGSVPYLRITAARSDRPTIRRPIYSLYRVGVTAINQLRRPRTGIPYLRRLI